MKISLFQPDYEFKNNSSVFIEGIRKQKNRLPLTQRIQKEYKRVDNGYIKSNQNQRQQRKYKICRTQIASSPKRLTKSKQVSHKQNRPQQLSLKEYSINMQNNKNIVSNNNRNNFHQQEQFQQLKETNILLQQSKDSLIEQLSQKQMMIERLQRQLKTERQYYQGNLQKLEEMDKVKYQLCEMKEYVAKLEMEINNINININDMNNMNNVISMNKMNNFISMNNLSNMCLSQNIDYDNNNNYQCKQQQSIYKNIPLIYSIQKSHSPSEPNLSQRNSLCLSFPYNNHELSNTSTNRIQKQISVIELQLQEIKIQLNYIKEKYENQSKEHELTKEVLREKQKQMTQLLEKYEEIKMRLQGNNNNIYANNNTNKKQYQSTFKVIQLQKILKSYQYKIHLLQRQLYIYKQQNQQSQYQHINTIKQLKSHHKSIIQQKITQISLLKDERNSKQSQLIKQKSLNIQKSQQLSQLYSSLTQCQNTIDSYKKKILYFEQKQKDYVKNLNELQKQMAHVDEQIQEKEKLLEEFDKQLEQKEEIVEKLRECLFRCEMKVKQLQEINYILNLQLKNQITNNIMKNQSISLINSNKSININQNQLNQLRQSPTINNNSNYMQFSFFPNTNQKNPLNPSSNPLNSSSNPHHLQKNNQFLIYELNKQLINKQKQYQQIINKNVEFVIENQVIKKQLMKYKQKCQGLQKQIKQYQQKRNMNDNNSEKYNELVKQSQQLRIKNKQLKQEINRINSKKPVQYQLKLVQQLSNIIFEQNIKLKQLCLRLQMNKNKLQSQLSQKQKDIQQQSTKLSLLSHQVHSLQQKLTKSRNFIFNLQQEQKQLLQQIQQLEYRHKHEQIQQIRQLQCQSNKFIDSDKNLPLGNSHVMDKIIEMINMIQYDKEVIKMQLLPKIVEIVQKNINLYGNSHNQCSQSYRLNIIQNIHKFIIELNKFKVKLFNSKSILSNFNNMNNMNNSKTSNNINNINHINHINNNRINQYQSIKKQQQIQFVLIQIKNIQKLCGEFIEEIKINNK